MRGKTAAVQCGADWEVCVSFIADYCFFLLSLKLSVSLKALEGERNQIYTQLSEVEKIKKNLTGKVFSMAFLLKENELLRVLLLLVKAFPFLLCL